jgi:hypothetical protein
MARHRLRVIREMAAINDARYSPDRGMRLGAGSGVLDAGGWDNLSTLQRLKAEDGRDGHADRKRRDKGENPQRGSVVDDL